MPLEVIGAGFGRTGTDSLKMGLLKLGYGDCYHMTEIPGKPGHEVLWLDAAEGNPDWDYIFKGCKAAVDFPASSFYEELAVHYPDAKVIVSTRDFEKWYKSVKTTIYTHGSPGFPQIICWKSIPYLNRCHRFLNATIWKNKDVFDGKFQDKEWTRNRFEGHANTVKSKIAADRVLVWEVQDGWEPLCKFLGKPVPDEPFPHSQLTDVSTMQLASRIVAVVGTLELVLFPISLPILAGCWAFDWFFFRQGAPIPLWFLGRKRKTN